jgi:xanthine/CO dehydrogenase XdhC/CoxF family maturation factor
VAGDSERIFTSIEEWSARGIEFALATVVGVRGSTYRGLGARQLVAADGASVGTVSGGCLDRDLQEVAMKVIESGSPQLVEFDLTADDEAVWGWGIGCNGATELLVEPAEGARKLVEIVKGGRAAAIIHPLDGAELGAHYAVGSGDRSQGEAVEQALTAGRNARAETKMGHALVEVMAGPPLLVVCGAGHDAVPLVRFGWELGFEVILVDDRTGFLNRERFPEATTLVNCQPIDLAKHVPTGPSTSVVIMSHNYLRDLDYLRSVLGTGVGYIGCLGPSARTQRMLEDLAAEGVEVGSQDMANLRGPAGLDMGAEGPVEIAWSIMAEILASRRGRDGGSLNGRRNSA